MHEFFVLVSEINFIKNTKMDDDDYRGKNYRGVEKKKRIALKDLMEDFYIEESDFLDYNPSKESNPLNKSSVSNYPYNNSYKYDMKKPTDPPTRIYFTKKTPVIYIHAKSTVSEKFDIRKVLKQAEKYKNRVFLRIKGYLDNKSRIALSLTCKYFYKEFYCDETSGILMQSYVQSLQCLLNYRSIYLFCRFYRQKIENCAHFQRYIYNATKYFKGKEILEGTVDSIEITSQSHLDLLAILNKASPDLINSRFNLSMLKQRDRDELFLWQAVFQTSSTESYPYLSRKYHYEESIKTAKFINDELFYVVTECQSGSSCLVYAAKIDGIENYLYQSPDEFQKATAPICHVICYDEYSEEFDEAWTKPIFIKKGYIPNDLSFLVDTECIYVISKSEGTIDVLNIKQNKLISSIKVENKDFVNYLESPMRNFFAVSKSKHLYHMIIQHQQNPDEIKIEFKKLEVPFYKSQTHNIHHTFTQFHDSNNILTEYLVYFSGPTAWKFQIYNISTQEFKEIEEKNECLSWNVHRGRIMLMTETFNLKVHDILANEQLFFSEKLNPFRPGVGRIGLVFDSFHALIAVQSELANVEVFSVTYPLNQSLFMTDYTKTSPESWNLFIKNIGEPERNKKRYLDMKYDNCHFYLRGENGSVLMDFVSILEIPKKDSVSVVSISKPVDYTVTVPKLKRYKKPKNIIRQLISDHITKLNYIPDIDNKLIEEDIVCRDYLVSVKNWNLPEDQQKDWPQILEESKNLSRNEKFNLVASLYRRTLRGHDFRINPIGKEVSYVIKMSNERKKKVGKVRSKQRDEKLNV